MNTKNFKWKPYQKENFVKGSNCVRVLVCMLLCEKYVTISVTMRNSKADKFFILGLSSSSLRLCSRVVAVDEGFNDELYRDFVDVFDVLRIPVSQCSFDCL